MSRKARKQKSRARIARIVESWAQRSKYAEKAFTRDYGRHPRPRNDTPEKGTSP